MHPQIPDLQILSKPYINGKIIYILEIDDWFCAPGQGSKLRPFWSHMLPKCNLCDSKIYLGAFVRVQIIAVVRPLQFSAKRSRITAQHVPRDRELKQVKLFIRALV